MTVATKTQDRILSSRITTTKTENKGVFFKKVNQTKTLQYAANCLLAERPNERIWDVTGVSLVNELLDDVQTCEEEDYHSYSRTERVKYHKMLAA